MNALHVTAPATLHGPYATVADAADAVCRGETVVLRVQDGYRVLNAADLAGFAATRRLIDVPARTVLPVPAQTRVSAFRARLARGPIPVLDGDALVGVAVKALADRFDVDILLHDLNNALTVLQTAVDLSEEPPQRERASELIRQGLHHVRDLVQRLNSLPCREEEVVRLDVLVAELIGSLRALCQHHGNPDLVLELVPASVGGDPSWLERILLNLISNAARHAGAGGTVWVEARAPQEGRGPALVVGNDGPVVPACELARVFEPGFTTSDGLGMGLASVCALAGRMKAEVDLHSVPGRTEVSVRFPVSPG